MKIRLLRLDIPIVYRPIGRPRAYRVIVDEYTLLPELPSSPRRYRVTVTLPWPERGEALVPLDRSGLDAGFSRFFHCPVSARSIHSHRSFSVAAFVVLMFVRYAVLGACGCDLDM